MTERVDFQQVELPEDLSKEQEGYFRELISFHRTALTLMANDIQGLVQRCVKCATLNETCPECIEVMGRGIEYIKTNWELELRRRAFNERVQAWLQEQGKTTKNVQ
jgi:hypothetical protein